MHHLDQRISFWLTHLTYAILCVMAIYFYQDRLASDTSYYFFKSLNARSFHVEHDRWVLMLAEWPVVLLSRLQAHLKWIAIAFSLWHVLFFYIIGFLAYRSDRNSHTWMLLLLLQTIGVMYGFVGPIFEQFYGTALAVWFYALLKKSKQHNIPMQLLLCLLAAWIMTSHPFNVILLLCLIGLDWVEYRSFQKYSMVFLLLPLYVYFKWLTASEYESGKVNWILNTEQNKTYQLMFDPVHIKGRLLFLWTYYWDLLGIGIVYMVWLIKRKRWLKLTIHMAFLGGIFLLINFGYDIVEYSGYHEQVYFILVPLILIPFMMDELKLMNLKTRVVLTLFLFGMVVYHIQKQYTYTVDFQQKRTMVQNWVQRAQGQNGTKFFVDFDEYKPNSQYINWDIPYYTLFYSSLHHFPKQVTIYPLGENQIALDSIRPNQYWFRLNEKEEVQTLNKTYFHLNTDSYQKLK